MSKNLCLALFAISVLAGPFYVFESGTPQPADLVMAFLIAAVFTGFLIRPPVHRDIYLVGALFLGDVTIVNWFWWTQNKTSTFLLSPLYFAFNFATAIVIWSLMKEFRNRFVVVCRATLAAAIILELVVVLAWPSYARSGLRSIGTFNNPNQLGYWGLLVSASLLVLKRDQRLNLFDLAILGGAGLVIMHSLSKAAMVSFTLLLGIAFVCQRPTRFVKAAIITVVLTSATMLIGAPSLVDRLLAVGIVAQVVDRLDNIGQQKDDSLAGRGYDRIWRYPQYLIFGAGEGAVWRFAPSKVDPQLGDLELHSTLGTVLFSYGILGFVLFACLIGLVFRPATWTHRLYSLPIWTYGLTHQGLRFTMFWVFLALVLGLTHYAESPARQRQPLGNRAEPTRIGPRPRGRLFGRPAAVRVDAAAEPK